MRTISWRGTANMPNGYCSRRSALVVNGNRARSASSPAVVGVDAGGVERPAGVLDVLVGVVQRPPQPFELQRPQLVDRRPLDRFERVDGRPAILHRSLPIGSPGLSILAHAAGASASTARWTPPTTRGGVRVSTHLGHDHDRAHAIEALGPPRLEEIDRGVFAYVQPDGTWWINNTGFVTARRRRRRHRQLRHGAPHPGLPRAARQRLVAADPRARQHPPPRRPHPRQLPDPPGDDRRPHAVPGAGHRGRDQPLRRRVRVARLGSTSSWRRRC